MSNAQQPDAPSRRWLVLLGLAMTYAVTNGVLIHTLPLLYPYLIESFGWTRTQVTQPATAFLIIAAVTSPPAGAVLDRYSARTVIAVGLIALLLCSRTLCLRMSERGVSRSITTVCYGVGATALVYIVSLGLLAAAGRHATLVPFLCCGCDFFVAAFFILWAVVLIDFTRRALNKSKARALETRLDD